MKLLILTPYYDPEPFGIAVVATGLATYMAEHGWKVPVLSGMPKTPQWEIFPAYRGKLLEREVRNGVDIVRTWIYCPRKPRSGRMKAWRRILSDTSMGLAPLAAAGALDRPDVILAISPPLQTAAAAIALKRLWNCPLLTWVQDIVPDAAMSVGMMQDGLAMRLGRGLEQFVYRNSDQIGVLSEGFARNLQLKGVPEEKLRQLTNWTDLTAFAGTSRREEFRERLHVQPDDFVLLHAGSMALKQDLSNVIHAMRMLSSRPNIKMFFLGDGICKGTLQTEALGLGNVRFLSTAALAEFPDMLRAADLLILNQAPNVVEAVAPSKLLNYMAATRPVLAASNAMSEAARLINSTHCGVVVDAAQPAQLASAIVNLQQRPDLRASYGKNGAIAVAERFSKDRALSKFDAVLRNLAGARQLAIPVGSVTKQTRAA